MKVCPENEGLSREEDRSTQTLGLREYEGLSSRKPTRIQGSLAQSLKTSAR